LFADFHEASLGFERKRAKKNAASCVGNHCSVEVVRLPSVLDLQASQRLFVSLLLFWSRLLGGLKAGVGSGSELVLELFDPTCGVHELEFAGIKRVANVANVNLELLAGAPGREAISTATGDLGFEIFWVDAVFHGRDLGGANGGVFLWVLFSGVDKNRDL
jgi:hypothetical protein